MCSKLYRYSLLPFQSWFLTDTFQTARVYALSWLRTGIGKCACPRWPLPDIVKIPWKGRKKEPSCDSPLSGWLSTSIESKQRKKILKTTESPRCLDNHDVKLLRQLGERWTASTGPRCSGEVRITGSVFVCICGEHRGPCGWKFVFLRMCVYLWRVQCSRTTQSFWYVGFPGSK